MRYKKLLVSCLCLPVALAQSQVVNQTTCNGQTYTYQQLVGYGYIPGNSTDRLGDTIGGIGSAISIPRNTFSKLPDGSYAGVLFAQPDRGWNTQGTLNYQGRIHQYAFTFRPALNATAANPSPPNIKLQYLNTILYTDPSGVPTTGLDPNPSGGKTVNGFPVLPLANYTGDGFGGAGPGGMRVPVDNEGLVVNNDATFWVSDEYGPYIYRYNILGRMIQAIQPPAAFLPMRNGSLSFSADSPPVYANETNDVSPTDPVTGRENNHGFEGLTASPDGRNLYVLIQAALDQEGGTKKSTERYARLLHYDVSGQLPEYIAEYVVPLPLYPSGSKPNTAAQSEIHYISQTQFLVLARDSGAGQCQSKTTSVYRHADVFDISSATNVMGSTYDCATCAVAPGGVLDPAITPATYCSWLDYNVNSELGRFGLHNGGAQDSNLLNEKWESLALLPVNSGSDGEYFIFSMSDNDFITQNGYQNFGRYKYSDPSGCNLNSQLLVFQATLPAGAAP